MGRFSSGRDQRTEVGVLRFLAGVRGESGKAPRHVEWRLVTYDARTTVRHDELSELAARVTSGDRRSVRTFLLAIGPHLIRVVRRVLGAAHPDVEDVAQEAAVAALDGLSRFRGEGTVLHLVCRIAVMTAVNVRRRELAAKRSATLAAQCVVEQMASSGPNPESSLFAQKEADAVRDLFATLPEAQGEALALHCVLGYTVGEIADTTGASVETVRSRLRLARQALRNRLLGDPALREMIGGAS